jgi:DNA-binding MarR family transcriptional regulator
VNGLAFMHNFRKAWCQGLTPSYIISGTFTRIKEASHLAPDADKTNPDFLIYMLWQSGQLTNQQIAEKFGLTYSAVSRRVDVFKDLLRKNRGLQKKINRVKALIKI